MGFKKKKKGLLQIFTCSSLATSNSLKRKQADKLPQEKIKRKGTTNWKVLAAEAMTLPGLQANLHASVALHTMSSQVYLEANKTICNSLVTKKYL